jgi:hydrogenase expression/formation protein HypE
MTSMDNRYEKFIGGAHCPVPVTDSAERIMLAHGEGGRLMRRLIKERIISRLKNDSLALMEDSSRLPKIEGELAMTTDSFVVSPLFFPGGDIGSLSVFGTVNDLAVSGAKPLYLTLGLIIEEGLPLVVLDRVMESISFAAAHAGVQIVAGDTKVVPHGAADGLFINTTGIGELMNPLPPGPRGLQQGDELIVTGPIGRHGIAVLCAREELALEPPPSSDCGSLAPAAEALRNRLGGRLRAMRDATRGGIAGVLHEWAAASDLTMKIDERQVPVSPDIRGACELLGLDPFHIANEGTMLVAVAQGASAEALAALRPLSETQRAAIIGAVESKRSTPVIVTRMFDREHPLDEPQGAPLPRIC